MSEQERLGFDEGMGLFKEGKYREAKSYFENIAGSDSAGQDGIYEKSDLFANLSEVGIRLASSPDPNVSITGRFSRAKEAYKELTRGSVLGQEEIEPVGSVLEEFEEGLHEFYKIIVAKHRKKTERGEL